jgi:hypothetical protein
MQQLTSVLSPEILHEYLCLPTSLSMYVLDAPHFLVMQSFLANDRFSKLQNTRMDNLRTQIALATAEE